MHLGFAFLHYQVYNSGRLHHLLTVWLPATTKQHRTEGALREPSSGAGCTAAPAKSKANFFPPPWLPFSPWSSFVSLSAPAQQTLVAHFP